VKLFFLCNNLKQFNMDSTLKIGIKGLQETVVNHENTASKYGSGLIDVFATPAMVALMEKTCLESILTELPEGFGSVGTAVNINHVKATPLGMKVWCESELMEVDGRKLVFKVRAWDEAGEIGNGEHTRFIIDNAKFMAKLKGR
jgi:fluoroacetyl-CoA thioesterase